MLTSFEQTLGEIANPAFSVTTSRLHSLSGPSRAQMVLFAQRWPTIDVERRRHIVQAMSELAEASFQVDFRPIFRFCLDDDDLEIRAMAIDGLWEDDDQALIALLVHLMEDDLSTLVRSRAAVALGKYVLLAEMDGLTPGRSRFLRKALLQVIRNPGEDVEVRRRAVESIAYFGDEEVRDIIEGAYYSAEGKMQVSAVFAMGRSMDPYWSGTVLLELQNPNAEMRFEAARANGELGNSRAVPILIELLEDPDREIQEVSIWALGQIGGTDARHALEAVAESEDEELAAAAEDALAELEFAEGELDLDFYNISISPNGNGYEDDGEFFDDDFDEEAE